MADAPNPHSAIAGESPPKPEAPSSTDTAAKGSESAAPSPSAHRLRKRLLLLAIVAGLAFGGYLLIPTIDLVNTLHR